MLTEHDLTETMRLIKPTHGNQIKKHLLLENFLVYWADADKKVLQELIKEAYNST